MPLQILAMSKKTNPPRLSQKSAPSPILYRPRYRKIKRRRPFTPIKNPRHSGRSKEKANPFASKMSRRL
jgi:hypothetical protein